MSVTVEELRVPNERALFEMITQDAAFMEVADALTDGKLTPEELDQLRQSAVPEAHLDAALDNLPDAQDLNPARLLLFLLERPLVLSLSRPARVRLLERLVALALADGALHDQERVALEACADHLALSPLVVTELLFQAVRPLD